MGALTQGRSTIMREGRFVSHPLAANAKVYSGALVVLDAAGYLKPGVVATTLKAAGVAEDDADNTGGANGAVSVQVRREGAFRFANHGADLVGRAHVLGNAYIVDDQTVAATDGAGTRSVAGKIVDVDALGVWIEFI